MAVPGIRTRAENILQAQKLLAKRLHSESFPYLLMESIRDLTGADNTSFVLQDNEVVIYGASTDKNWEKRKPSQTVVRKAFASADGFYLHNVTAESVTESQIQEGIRSCMAAKVGVHGSFIGAVYCDIRQQDAQFSNEDAAFLKELCTYFSVYFSYLALVDTTKELKQSTEENIQQTVLNFRDLNLIVGTSQVIVDLREEIMQASSYDWPVLIQGETGTGKELVARSIHYHSGRAHQPFVVVNCSAIPKELVESELFGTKEGAFSGAVYRRGRILKAEHGTLFLDEVGELPPEIQAKLLRAVEYREVQQLGSDDLINNVDFRLITATNKPLEKMVRDGNFRLDFYERINVKGIYVAPLRERTEDIPLIANYFAAPKYFSKEAMDHMVTLDYPGNVRRLKMISLLARDQASGTQIGREDLESIIQSMNLQQQALTPELRSENQHHETENDFYRFKMRYQRAFREFKESRKAQAELSGESQVLISELDSILQWHYSRCGAWTEVAKSAFHLKTKQEIRGFVNWIYQLQRHRAFNPRSDGGRS